MALLHQAQLTPSKIELLSAWVPAQSWLGDADASAVESLGSYRFDDPAGEVGIETHLLKAGGHVLQVPVTYRSGPLPDAESALITTAEHSVLGTRWVYDATADPVYVAALVQAIVTGGTEAAVELATETGNQQVPLTTRVAGSGSPDAEVPAVSAVRSADAGTTTVIAAGDLTLTVLRLINSSGGLGSTHTLTGTWPGQSAPVLLAFVG